MNKKEQIGDFIKEFVTNELLERWSEKYSEEFPDVFRVEISLCPVKVLKISDRYETKEELVPDDHFERVAGYTNLFVMNFEDEKKKETE